MTASQNRRHNLRRGTAIALLIVAAGVFVYFRENFLIRSLAILVGMFAALVVNPRQESPLISARRQEKQHALALRPWHWLVGLALAIAVAASLMWLYHDAETGGKDGTPVYVFAASAVICGAWWAGLYARWMEFRG